MTKKIYLVSEETGHGTLAVFPQAAVDVLEERLRQHDMEGWTPEHDDQHTNEELANAAASYAMSDDKRCMEIGEDAREHLWPWDKSWWKPSENRRRDLVRAGALILAEIERLDRAAEKE